MLKKSLAAFAMCIAGLLICSLPVLSQHKPLEYHGGQVLRSFKIYPLYFGAWNNDDLTTQQNYLENLTAYLSGKNKPVEQQPMTWQYGVNEASVAPAATDNSGKPNATLSTKDIESIIKKNQNNKKLPEFGPNTLIMVFPAHGIGLADCVGCGFHNSESSTAYWAVVPQDAGVGQPIGGQIPESPGPMELVVGHEVLEAALNPAINYSQGWDEAVDGCPDGMTSFGGSWIKLSFGWVPGVTDDTQNGQCSTTGYNSAGEVQIYGSSYTDYRKKYDELWPLGWRLYILQSYLAPGGDLLYNAVWRQCTSDEQQIYGSSYSDYKKKYDELFPKGWRLYIFQAYEAQNGVTLYNAVWRNGDLGESQVYSYSLKQYRDEYDNLWNQKLRLQILQTYVAGGKVLYNAVWRPGELNEEKIYGKSYTDFRKRYDELWPKDWRLYILQSYVTPKGKVLYNAVWRPWGGEEEQVYGYSFSDYKKKYDELWPVGWRLYILDAYVDNGIVLYNAVWRQGVYDRPL